MVAMKKLINILLLIPLLSFKDKCDTDAMLEQVVPTLQPYTFMKKFDIVDKKTEYSYVFSRDSEYKIMASNGGKEVRLILNLYDRNKKLISSNYVKSSKKIYPSVTYKCAATGVYYVESFFEDEKEGCGINVLGFKK